MIKIGEHLINPAFVSSMSWERRDYMNCGPDHTLVIYMANGRQIKIKHEPQFGTDAFLIERTIQTALTASDRRSET